MHPCFVAFLKYYFVEITVSLLILTWFRRYQRKALMYNERVEELNAATQERDDLKKQYDGLRKKR